MTAKDNPWAAAAEAKLNAYARHIALEFRVDERENAEKIDDFSR